MREVAKWGKVATGTKPKGVKDKTDSDEVSGLFPTPSGLPGFGLPKRLKTYDEVEVLSSLIFEIAKRNH